MGYIQHNAIIVSSWNVESIENARAKAQVIFGGKFPLIKSPLNNYQSFLVAPDGSKEGWPESDTGDVRRLLFIEWLDAQRYEDGSSSLQWVHVEYGEGDSVVIQSHQNSGTGP